MPRQNNDRLEEFFRKAAEGANVPFNESDWKKLEARLDAADDGAAAAKISKGRTAAVTGVILLLLLSGGWWVSSRLMTSGEKPQITADGAIGANESKEQLQSPVTENHASAGSASSDLPSGDEISSTANQEKEITARETIETSTTRNVQPVQRKASPGATKADEVHQDIIADGRLTDRGRGDKDLSNGNEPAQEVVIPDDMDQPAAPDNALTGNGSIERVSATAEKNKQKADVQLPGAEEGNTGEAEAMVTKQHASEKKHVATPRLSLLLSFAPDFSSTSNQYSAPGKAFGAMLYYHFLPRWSVSAGVIKNNKRYTGEGEDYTPPTGYWIRNTNGVVPYSIDGSCSVVEFPLMIQYTVASGNKHRWLASAGASSYLMLSETYTYNFEEPNPGAKYGWASKGSSRFMFNMVNLAVGYEHQVFPGLMVGIEPYVKIPIEAIGWTNIKLFSTGASVSLRYTILGRRNSPIPDQSRGPD